MKKFVIEKHLNKNIAWFNLLAINDLERPEQLEKMLKIAEIFEIRSFYAVCQVFKNKNIFDSIRSTCETGTVYARKKYDTIAVNADGNTLTEIFKFASANDECTEVVVVNDCSWEKFIAQKGQLKNQIYDVLFLIKDNCETHVAFNKERYDFEKVKLKIRQILEP